MENYKGYKIQIAADGKYYTVYDGMLFKSPDLAQLKELIDICTEDESNGKN